MAKDTFYFSHDYGSRNDPKLIRVLMVMGHEGKGIFWDLIEMLYEQNGYLKNDEIDLYAFAIKTDPDKIKQLINDFDLFESDDTEFWSDSVIRRLEERDARSKKYQDNAAKRWSKKNKTENQDVMQTENDCIANDMQLHNNSNAIALALQSNCNALKERKGKERKEIKGKERKEEKSENDPSIQPNDLNKILPKQIVKIETAIDLIKSDKWKSWRERFCMQKSMTMDDVFINLDKFIDHCKDLNQFEKSASDAQSHFESYINKGLHLKSKQIAPAAPKVDDQSNPPDNSGNWVWINQKWRDKSKMTPAQLRAIQKI